MIEQGSYGDQRQDVPGDNIMSSATRVRSRIICLNHHRWISGSGYRGFRPKMIMMSRSRLDKNAIPHMKNFINMMNMEVIQE